MNKVRIIVKQTIQPPIDTPASRRWHTVEIESPELADMLTTKRDKPTRDERDYSVFEIVGAELIGSNHDH